MKKDDLKIGLALGSGGTKGYSHIGVLNILEKEGINIDYISGSSIGALGGALYSYHDDSKKVEEISLTPKWQDIFSISDASLRGGLIKGKEIEDFINEKINNATFDDLAIPLKILATDYKKGDKVELESGSIASAVHASIAFPFIFKPVNRGNKILWDGGLSDPIPVKTLKEMGADIVIAVNLSNETILDKKEEPSINPYRVMVRSISVLEYNLAKMRIKEADLVINPDFNGLNFFNFHKILRGGAEDILKRGEKAMRDNLDSLKRIINS